MDDLSKEKGIADDLTKDLLQVERFRTIREALRADGTTPKQEEKLQVNVGEIVTAQGKLVSDAYSKLMEVTSNKPSAAEDPFIKFLMDRFGKMEDRLNQPNDPIATAVETASNLMSLMETMKKHLGVPEAARVTTSDLPGLIELEERKLAREESQRRWDTEMAEKRHQWEIENRRWENEFNLKRLEFIDGRKARDSAMDAFGDLAGSLAESVQVERTGGIRAKGPSFKCTGCGSVVSYKTTDTEVICEGCGMLYTKEPESKKMPRSPVEAAPGGVPEGIPQETPP